MLGRLSAVERTPRKNHRMRRNPVAAIVSPHSVSATAGKRHGIEALRTVIEIVRLAAGSGLTSTQIKVAAMRYPSLYITL